MEGLEKLLDSVARNGRALLTGTAIMLSGFGATQAQAQNAPCTIDACVFPRPIISQGTCATVQPSQVYELKEGETIAQRVGTFRIPISTDELYNHIGEVHQGRGRVDQVRAGQATVFDDQGQKVEFSAGSQIFFRPSEQRDYIAFADNDLMTAPLEWNIVETNEGTFGVYAMNTTEVIDKSKDTTLAEHVGIVSTDITGNCSASVRGWVDLVEPEYEIIKLPAQAPRLIIEPRPIPVPVTRTVTKTDTVTTTPFTKSFLGVGGTGVAVCYHEDLPDTPDRTDDQRVKVGGYGVVLQGQHVNANYLLNATMSAGVAVEALQTNPTTIFCDNVEYFLAELTGFAAVADSPYGGGGQVRIDRLNVESDGAGLGRNMQVMAAGGPAAHYAGEKGRFSVFAGPSYFFTTSRNERFDQDITADGFGARAVATARYNIPNSPNVFVEADASGGAYQQGITDFTLSSGAGIELGSFELLAGVKGYNTTFKQENLIKGGWGPSVSLRYISTQGGTTNE